MTKTLGQTAREVYFGEDYWASTKPDSRAEWEAVAAAVAAEVRKQCIAACEAHECGGPDDVVCQGRNCGMLIAAAIRSMK